MNELSVDELFDCIVRKLQIHDLDDLLEHTLQYTKRKGGVI